MTHATLFTTERSLFHQQRALRAAPPELRVTMLQNPARSDLLAHLREAEYWISERVGVIDSAVLRAAPHLKLILRLGSRTHDIDLAAAQAQGTAVCKWPDITTLTVAEHCVMQILALLKKLRETEAVALAAGSQWGESRPTDENTFHYNWSQRQHINRLWGRTVGILGLGEIGTELARRLHGWGCALLYHKRSRLPERAEAELGVTYADMHRLCQQSDVVVSLLPYAPDTINLINAEWLGAMKAGATLVSCGSGGTIDEAALADAVRRGHVVGAAMDSYSVEPLLPDNPLVLLAREGANILLTPHVAAGNSPSRAEDYTNILRHLRGEPLLHRLV